MKIFVLKKKNQWIACKAVLNILVALSVLTISRGGGRPAIHRALETQFNVPANCSNLPIIFNINFWISRTSNTAKQSMLNSTDRRNHLHNQNENSAPEDMSIGIVLKRKKFSSNNTLLGQQMLTITQTHTRTQSHSHMQTVNHKLYTRTG